MSQCVVVAFAAYFCEIIKYELKRFAFNYHYLLQFLLIYFYFFNDFWLAVWCFNILLMFFIDYENFRIRNDSILIDFVSGLCSFGLSASVFNVDSLLFAIILLALFSINYIGAGDVKLIIGSFIYISQAYIFIFYISIFSISLFILQRKRAIPMAPSILVSRLICMDF
ncbi:hypothetical protein [Candidatus Gromoviella agglomerans]|uniref:hypothetical protein n=1 Tax=Candidatus Gromoviella agglomerans TaxID=2806609 RepID=UPI001E501A8F|nr:hypothetical protein [Candidatus Gromoviella agglomerans]